MELWLAWTRVQGEIQEGMLGSEFDRADLAEVRDRVRDAEEAAKDEVWAGYRYVILADQGERDGLKVIDLGAGHASAAETLSGRIVGALRSEALLNESVGAGYLERHWPPALQTSGAWPLPGLRQAFVNGTLTRLLGTASPELWNRLGIRILPKLRSSAELRIGVDFSVTVDGNQVEQLAMELRQALEDLGLRDTVRIE